MPATRWRIVFWEMSTLLGMHYWAFTELPAAAPNTTEAKQNNVVVDVASVIKVGGGGEGRVGLGRGGWGRTGCPQHHRGQAE